ncbi:MAG TPA: C39 family peptidase, partial [Parachlamydiaceae bacterium]|nr:C39 family peptidase [Parachlamydiaceae bacterium]
LGKKWHCWVQHLTGFDDIHARLRANMPVVVSVKGPLSGSALPYSEGHLLVVKGYNHKEKQVICMDPAFADNESTNVSYDLDDFMKAWSKRGCIAYIFEKGDQNFSDIQFNSNLSSQ